MGEKSVRLPEKRTPGEDVLKRMEALRADDANWREGRTWSLVYHGGDEYSAFLKAAYNMFFSENGLNPIAFPSLKKFEAEVISMAAHMLGGDEDAAGTMTSGGTESILMAVKTHRDWARAEKPHIKEPEMVLPASAHPAFAKAAHYFDVKAVVTPIGPDYRADVEAARKAVGDNTILMVGSAPSYPHGMVDDIPALAAIAKEAGVGFHVDACLGGFLLPFVKKLGHPITDFDFRVPGVTSMSADIHKYGFAAKGASVVLYRNADLRRHQFFVYTDWCGGLYGSPSMAGTRPGGAIAAAWAAMTALGEQGYLDNARRIMAATKTLKDGIAAIKGLRVVGDPPASVFAFTSDDADAFAVGDELGKRGWNMDRQQNPHCLHLMVTMAHEAVAGRFLEDLAASVEAVRANPRAASEGMAAVYGMMATLPDRGMVKDFILQFLDGLYEE